MKAENIFGAGTFVLLIICMRLQKHRQKRVNDTLRAFFLEILVNSLSRRRKIRFRAGLTSSCDQSVLGSISSMYLEAQINAFSYLLKCIHAHMYGCLHVYTHNIEQNRQNELMNNNYEKSSLKI